jgi:uncharacterized membrane protein YhaH (DUF805 family)
VVILKKIYFYALLKELKFKYFNEDLAYKVLFIEAITFFLCSILGAMSVISLFEHNLFDSFYSYWYVFLLIFLRLGYSIQSLYSNYLIKQWLVKQEKEEILDYLTMEIEKLRLEKIHAHTEKIMAHSTTTTIRKNKI